MDRKVIRSAARWLVCLLFTLSWATGAMAQQTGQVAGRITDNNGAPLSGVQVAIQGTQLGALSNEQGRYLILRVPPGTVTVNAIRLGYGTISRTVTVAAGGTANADFQLAVEAIALEGLVAVGYGTQKKVNVTGSVAAAPIAEVAKLPVPTLNVALQGVAPGLQVFDGGNWPGREVINMTIRGRTTIGGGSGGNITDAGRSAPLVLIDGIEGTINNIDVDDVEAISVLKDAASSAIYGSRAANGVILVTTKRGQARDKIQISYNGYYGMQTLGVYPEQVSVADHMRLTNLAYTNSGRAPKYSAGYMDSTVRRLDPLKYPTTNDFDILYDPAPIQDHTVRVSGGSESARFALSMGYQKTDGMTPTSGSDRYDVRLNTDFRASERMTAGLDLNATRRWSITPYESWATIFYLLHDTPPTYNLKFPDGTYGFSDTNRNPLAYAERSGDNQMWNYQGVVSGRANYDIIPGWVQLQTLGSVRWDYGQNNQFRRNEVFYDYWDPTKRRFSIGPTRSRQYDDTGLQTTIRALLDYGHTFNQAHDISGVVGVEQIQQDNQNIYAGRDNAYSNDLRLISMGDEGTDSNSGGASEWGLQSVYGRFNYSFKGRYLLEANARYDGSSRFSENNRWGFFPSFSAGWRISEESFFPFDWMNELKLRGSWGELGNQTVGLYSYYSSISLSNPYYFNNALVTGAAKTAIQNPNITWETTEATDVGLDAAFLSNRLTVTADYYYRKTRDILLSLPIPAVIGMSAPVQNAGVVENKGWEFQAGWKDRKGDFSYSVDVNLSDNQNKVLDLVGTGPYVSGEMVVMEGQPINSWYGYEAVGLFKDQAEINAWPKQNTEFTHPGDIKWKDQNGDNQLTSADYVPIGDPNPRYMFGINLSASYKNFDFSALAQGVGKRDQYVALGLAEGPVWENHISKWHLDYWTPENQDSRLPAYYLYQNYNTNRVSSWWVLDAKFIKLRNLQLGYTLPASMAERVGVSRMRLYISGKNLWQASGMDIELDPESPWVRGDYLPQTRVFSIGTDINF